MISSFGGVALTINMAIYAVGLHPPSPNDNQKTYEWIRINWDLQGWPASARSAALSVLVFAVAFVIGQVAKRVVATRLSALARRTGSDWVEAVVGAVARRVRTGACP